MQRYPKLQTAQNNLRKKRQKHRLYGRILCPINMMDRLTGMNMSPISTLVVRISSTVHSCKIQRSGPTSARRTEKHEMSYKEIQRRLNKILIWKHAETYLLELRNRKRRRSESLQELGRSIPELTSRACPDFDTKGVDRLAKIHFADAIVNQDIRAGIFHAKADTLDEMIFYALCWREQWWNSRLR